MTRGTALLVAAVVLVLFTATKGALGFVLAAAGIGVVYFASIRFSPRTRHRGCKGSGEVRSKLFPWSFRKCPDCAGGRLVRFGAGHWGQEHVQREYQTGKETRKAAKKDHRWR